MNNPLQNEETKRDHPIRESRVPPPGRPLRRYRRGNSHNSSLETEETSDRHLESLLRSRKPSEDAGSKIDDRRSPGKSRLLHGRLEDYGQGRMKIQKCCILIFTIDFTSVYYISVYLYQNINFLKVLWLVE